MECYCDHDPPQWYRSARPKARRTHKCYECGSPILPGHTYEYVAAKWYDSGGVDVLKTCPACLMLRDAGFISFPCFRACWSHGNMLDELQEWVREEAYKVEGLRFEFGRRYVKAQRMRDEARLAVREPA